MHRWCPLMNKPSNGNWETTSSFPLSLTQKTKLLWILSWRPRMGVDPACFSPHFPPPFSLSCSFFLFSLLLYPVFSYRWFALGQIQPATIIQTRNCGVQKSEKVRDVRWKRGKNEGVGKERVSATVARISSLANRWWYQRRKAILSAEATFSPPSDFLLFFSR